MAGVQVRVLLSDLHYGEFNGRFTEHLTDQQMSGITPKDCHQAYFKQQYAEWLTVRSKDACAVINSARADGWPGDPRYLVVTFGEDDRDCAMLFKLTFGGR